MKARFFIYFLILVLLASCKDKEEAPPVDPAIPAEPQLNIITPTLNAHYNQGDDIIIKADVSDDKQIYITYVQIKNVDNNTIVYDPGEIHNHVTSFTLNLTYNVSQTTASRYILIIKVTDFDGHITEKQVQLWIN